MQPEDLPPAIRDSTTTSFFLEAELELADEFLADANSYIEAGLHFAARESLQNAESAIQIIERYLQLFHQLQGAATYVNLIQERRQRVLVMQEWIPVSSSTSS